MKKLSMFVTLIITLLLASYSFAGTTPPLTEHEITTLITKANQGDHSAKTVLGVLYTTGAGVEVNHVEAFKYYKLAASQGKASD